MKGDNFGLNVFPIEAGNTIKFFGGAWLLLLKSEHSQQNIGPKCSSGTTAGKLKYFPGTPRAFDGFKFIGAFRNALVNRWAHIFILPPPLNLFDRKKRRKGNVNGLTTAWMWVRPPCVDHVIPCCKIRQMAFLSEGGLCALRGMVMMWCPVRVGCRVGCVLSVFFCSMLNMCGVFYGILVHGFRFSFCWFVLVTLVWSVAGILLTLLHPLKAQFALFSYPLHQKGHLLVSESTKYLVLHTWNLEIFLTTDAFQASRVVNICLLHLLESNTSHLLGS